jgi:hypothetical protein
LTGGSQTIVRLQLRFSFRWSPSRLFQRVDLVSTLVFVLRSDLVPKLSILANSGITDILSIDGREVPIQSVTKAIRESFLNHRAKELVQKVTDQVVTAYSRK